MMEQTPRRSDLPLLLTLLVVFLLLAVEFGGAEDPNGALTHVNLEPCISGGKVKRLDDVDYNSFVGLMGRRNAAEPNRHLARFLAALLGDERCNSV